MEDKKINEMNDLGHRSNACRLICAATSPTMFVFDYKLHVGVTLAINATSLRVGKVVFG